MIIRDRERRISDPNSGLKQVLNHKARQASKQRHYGRAENNQGRRNGHQHKVLRHMHEQQGLAQRIERRSNGHEDRENSRKETQRGAKLAIDRGESCVPESSQLRKESLPQPERDWPSTERPSS